MVLFFLSILNFLAKSDQCDGSKRCSFTSTEVTISGTTFSDLSSGNENGGAVFIDNCEVSISESSFTNCKTNKKGGAVYCQQSTSHAFSLRDCNFNKCIAFDGGGLFYKQTVVSSDEVSNCIFNECKASGLGGGAFFQSNGGSVVDCSFTSCEAEFSGGSLTYWNEAVSGDSGIIQRCTFDAVLSLYNPNIFYTTTREKKGVTVLPIKIADCKFFAQSNWQNNPGCFLIAAQTGIDFEGTNLIGGDEDSIVWSRSGKVESSSIQYNSVKTDDPSQPSSKPSSKPSSNPTTNPTSNPASNPASNPTSNPTKNPSQQPITSSSSVTSVPTSKPSSNPTSDVIHTTTQTASPDVDYNSQINDIKQQTRKLKLISIIFIAAVAILLLIICPILIYFIVKTVKNGNSKTTISLHEPMI